MSLWKRTRHGQGRCTSAYLWEGLGRVSILRIASNKLVYIPVCMIPSLFFTLESDQLHNWVLPWWFCGGYFYVAAS